jgi:hypothetical protein
MRYDRAVKRSGVADLPLHGGRVPPWLATRMVMLGTAIVESVLYHYGGKDGHPLPVPLRVYDESISTLRRAIDLAKLGQSEKLDGMSRLDAFVRGIERRRRPEADVEATIAHERATSRSLGGRTLLDDRRPRKGQMNLF